MGAHVGAAGWGTGLSWGHNWLGQPLLGPSLAHLPGCCHSASSHQRVGTALPESSVPCTCCSCLVMSAPPAVYAAGVPHVQLPDILSRNIPCRPQVYDAAVPFGGYKDSGLGREKGEYALKNYSQVSERQLRPG